MDPLVRSAGTRSTNRMGRATASRRSCGSPGLHIPETYTAALVQTACRDKGWPLDKSTLYTEVTPFVEADEVTEKLEHGAYIEGLYLEGASWDAERSRMTGAKIPKVLVTELPILQVIPIEASKLKLQNTFKTPVYVTQSRRNAMGVGLVFEADASPRTSTPATGRCRASRSRSISTSETRRGTKAGGGGGRLGRLQTKGKSTRHPSRRSWCARTTESRLFLSLFRSLRLLEVFGSTR